MSEDSSLLSEETINTYKQFIRRVIPCSTIKDPAMAKKEAIALESLDVLCNAARRAIYWHRIADERSSEIIRLQEIETAFRDALEGIQQLDWGPGDVGTRMIYIADQILYKYPSPCYPSPCPRSEEPKAGIHPASPDLWTRMEDLERRVMHLENMERRIGFLESTTMPYGSGVSHEEAMKELEACGLSLDRIQKAWERLDEPGVPLEDLKPAMVFDGDNSLASRLTYCRKNQGFLQKVVAEACGLSAAFLSQLERGERGIVAGTTLVRLAEFYGVTAEWLLTGKNQK